MDSWLLEITFMQECVCKHRSAQMAILSLTIYDIIYVHAHLYKKYLHHVLCNWFYDYYTVHHSLGFLSWSSPSLPEHPGGITCTDHDWYGFTSELTRSDMVPRIDKTIAFLG